MTRAAVCPATIGLRPGRRRMRGAEPLPEGRDRCFLSLAERPESVTDTRCAEERTSIFSPLLLTGYLVLFALAGVETESAFG